MKVHLVLSLQFFKENSEVMSMFLISLKEVYTLKVKVIFHLLMEYYLANPLHSPLHSNAQTLSPLEPAMFETE